MLSRKSWLEHHGPVCPVKWEMFKDADQFADFMAALGGRKAAKICEYILKDHR